ncbi:MAG: hypothetical protein KatS3mg061_1873 [Dehalococcoidia bacterium]|nr:MAG: hypothetical protein KatS3mg061_1873 [Dehalococcoidia bacterium]
MATALPPSFNEGMTAPVPGGEWDEFADRVHGALGLAIQRARGGQARPPALAAPVLADLRAATDALLRLSVLVAYHIRVLLGEPARLDIIPSHLSARQARSAELRSALLASLGRYPAIASAALRLARALPPDLLAQADRSPSDKDAGASGAALTTLTAGG